MLKLICLFNLFKITLTNINKEDTGKWLMYDSLNDVSNLKSIKSTLIRLANEQQINGRIEVYSVNMQQQDEIYDCGLFAIACAFELCKGNDPAKIKFMQNQMRKHFQTCLDKNELTSFPQEPRTTTLIYQLHKFNRK